MRGFIETMNEIRDECRSHKGCSPECPFYDVKPVRMTGCYWQALPEKFDPLEIMRRLQDESLEDDKGGK